jgi:uncharacterized protein
MIMQLSLKQLASKEQPVQLTAQLDLSDTVKGMPEIVRSSPLLVDLTARRDSGAIEVSGTLTVNLVQPCSRCLSPVDEKLTVPFNERFVQKSEFNESISDEDLHVMSEDIVDLTPYIMESLWIELPMAPLCKEDCLGLCPDCGTNRNESPCGCRQETIDPRLAGLADFFNKE